VVSASQAEDASSILASRFLQGVTVKEMLTSAKDKQPKQFGDMHERALFLMDLLTPPEVRSVVPVDVWHAIWDLKNEVFENAARPAVCSRWPEQKCG